VTREQIRAVIERYVDGQRPAAIAAALGLDAEEIERLCTGPTSLGTVAAAALGKRPKRARRAKAPAPAPEGPSATDPEADFDPAAGSRYPDQRAGVTSQRNHGYGFVTVRGGGRRI